MSLLLLLKAGAGTYEKTGTLVAGTRVQGGTGAAMLQPTTAPQSFIHTPAATSDTGSVTVDAGLDRCLLLLVQNEGDVGGTVTVSSADYGGVALTRLSETDPNTWSHTEVWYLVNPAVGTATLTVNFSASDVAVWGVIVGQNVDQGTPLRTAGVNSGTGTSSSITVTGVSDLDLVIDTLAIDSTGHAPVAGADQTERWDTVVSSNVSGAVSTQGGSTGGAMSWTWTGSSPFSHIATAFIPTGGVVYQKTGALTAGSAATGLDVFEAVEVGSPKAGSVTLAADVFEAVETGKATSATFAVADSQKVSDKANTAVAGSVARAADVFEATEVGTATSASKATGADVSAFTETGTATSASKALGTDVFEATETGTATAGTTARGTAQAGFTSKLGSATTGSLAFGSDVFTATETGVAASVSLSLGSNVWEAARTGIALSRALATGTSTKVAPGTYQKAGTATTRATAIGADVYTASETGTVTARVTAKGPGAAASAIARWNVDTQDRWGSGTAVRWEVDPSDRWEPVS